jgi:Mrp family chromosome partitioning ATPase/capsular polysaccharide biosynthesis protein
MSIQQQELGSKTSDVLAFLRRRGLLVLGVTALVTAVTFVVSSRERPLYQANASVLLTYQDQAGGALSKINPVVLARQALTEAKLARITPVAELAVKLAGSHRTASQLLAESSVQSDINDNLLQFSVSDSDRTLATALANAYVRAFVENHTKLATAAVSGQLTALNREISKLNKLLVTGPEPARQVRAQLAPLVLRRQEIQRSIVAQQGDVLPVQTAPTAKRVRPQPSRDTLLGALAGLVLGLGIAVLMNGLDTRAYSGKEAREQLGLPMLARIPRLPRRLRRAGVVMFVEPHGSWADAFRRLGTTVGYLQSTTGARVLLVTSAQRGEGTSTVATNLAVAMAQSGKRVILADLNLRAPTVSAMFGVPGNPGVLDVLTGEVELARALSRVSLAVGPVAAGARTLNGHAGSLSVLPVAHTNDTPAEYRNTATLADLVTSLGQAADLTIIDAPAMGTVSDAMPLAFLADAILVVARTGVANRNSLADLRASLQRCPTIGLGFVLNGASGRGAHSEYEEVTPPGQAALEPIYRVQQP